MGDAGGWSCSDSLALCREGEDRRYEGRALFLDRDEFTSVEAAVEALNSGRVECADGFCVVYAALEGQYHVLHRRGRRRVATDAFGLREAEDIQAALLRSCRKGTDDGSVASRRSVAVPTTIEGLLAAIEAERARAAEAEAMLQKSAEFGQQLLAEQGDLERRNQELREQCPEITDGLAYGEIQELHEQNEGLLARIDRFQSGQRRRFSAAKSRSNTSAASSFTDAGSMPEDSSKEDSPIQLLQQSYDEDLVEWEERLQQEAQKLRALQEEHGQLSQNHERLESEHDSLLESERSLKQALEEMLGKKKREQQAATNCRRTSASSVGRRSRMLSFTAPIPMEAIDSDEGKSLQGENARLHEENKQLLEQLMVLEARLLQLELEAEDVDHEVSAHEQAHEQEKASLVARQNELRGMLEHARRPQAVQALRAQRSSAAQPRKGKESAAASPASPEVMSMALEMQRFDRPDSSTSTPSAAKPLVGLVESIDLESPDNPISWWSQPLGDPSPREYTSGGWRVLCELPCVCARVCLVAPPDR